MKRFFSVVFVSLTLLIVVTPYMVQSQTTWTVPDLVNFVSADLDKFWQAVFDANNFDYTTPSVFAYDGNSRTACGVAQNDNALYCSVSHSIHYDESFMNALLNQIGDFAVATVIAHEWGHAIQVQLGLLTRSSVQNELQADCLAGAYAHYAAQSGILEAGDVDEARTLMAQLGDPPTRGRRGNLRLSHGTAAQRVGAFNTGYQQGLEGCF